LRQFPKPSIPTIHLDVRDLAIHRRPVALAIRLDVLKRLPVHPGRAIIGFAPGIGQAQNIRSIHLVVQKIEPILGFCLRFRM
jgi:hypothetical protein